MKKSEIKIPIDELPEGIRLSLKNSDRYFKDSKILFNRGKLSSANTLMFLAMEEFSKAKILIDHLKKKKAVTNDNYKQYFRDHELRLGEFERFFEVRGPKLRITKEEARAVFAELINEGHSPEILRQGVMRWRFDPSPDQQANRLDIGRSQSIGLIMPNR